MLCAPCADGGADLGRFLRKRGFEQILEQCVAKAATVEALAALAQREDDWDDFTEEAGISSKAAKKLAAALADTVGHAPDTAFLDDDERQELLDYWGDGWELSRVLKRMNGQPGTRRAKMITELYAKCSESNKPKDEPTHLLELRVKGQANPLPLRWYPGLPEQNYDPSKRYYTLLVLGETGVGKTTLLDAFANHLSGVNYHDLWRYKLVNENSMLEKDGGQSQTTDISYYYITDVREDIREAERCHVKIIDSPGFGDTGGIQADRAIGDKFKALFTNELDELDYILVVVKSTESRWTSRAKYVYDNVQQLFGSDASKRFVLMCTFADGSECLAARMLMPQLDCLCGCYFTFNNSALYTPQKLGNATTLMFWKMCMTSVKTFLKFITDESKPPLSMVQSKEVIQTREYLKVSIATTRTHINSCMRDLEYMHKVLKDIKENEDKINMNGTYTLPPQTVVKYRWVKRTDTKPTQFCKICQVPCCQICEWRMGEDLSPCTYFNRGPCPVCPGHCPRSAHKRWVEVDYQEKYEEQVPGVDIHKKNMLEEGRRNKTFAEELLATKVSETEALAKELLAAMQRVKESQGKLEAIALKPKVFADMQYFEQMIKTENTDKKPGYEWRVAQLEAMREEIKALGEVQRVTDWKDLFPKYKEMIDKVLKKTGGKQGKATVQSPCAIS